MTLEIEFDDPNDLREFQEWVRKFDAAASRASAAIHDCRDSEKLSPIKQRQDLKELRIAASELEWAAIGHHVARLTASSFEFHALASGMDEIERICETIPPAEWEVIKVGMADQLLLAIEVVRRRLTPLSEAVSRAVANLPPTPIASIAERPAEDESDLMTREEIAWVIGVISEKTLANQKLLGMPATAGGGRGRKSQWHYLRVKPSIEQRIGQPLPGIDEAWEIIRAKRSV